MRIYQDNGIKFGEEDLNIYYTCEYIFSLNNPILYKITYDKANDLLVLCDNNNNPLLNIDHILYKHNILILKEYYENTILPIISNLQ